MLRLSYIPAIWKFAQITMIPKPGKPVNGMGSYRPISLLPILSRLFEILFLNRLRNDIELQDLTPDYQFGFREHHSIIQQTHRMLNKISVSLRKRRSNFAQQRF
jgi:hypothetical protein